MASEEDIAELRDRLGDLGAKPKRPAIDALARAVDEAVGGEPIKLRGAGRTNVAILSEISFKIEAADDGGPAAAAAAPPRSDSASSAVTDVGDEEPSTPREPAPAPDTGASPQAATAPPPTPAGPGLLAAAASAASSMGSAVGIWGRAVPIAADPAVRAAASPDVLAAAKKSANQRTGSLLDEDYDTVDVSLATQTLATVDLANLVDDVASEVAQHAGNPEVQAAIVAATIDALRTSSGEAQPSPHEAAAVDAMLGTLQAAQPSPLKTAISRSVSSAEPPAAKALAAQVADAGRRMAGLQAPGDVSSVVQQTPPAAAPMADRADDIIGAVRAGAQTTANAVAANSAALQGAITAAIDRGAARDGPLDPDQTVAVLDNLRDNPLTAQLVAQGRLKPQDVLDPAEVASYERALRERRVKREASGQDEKETSTRLAAQPMLTRYVVEPASGARRYRPPRFAGPQY